MKNFIEKNPKDLVENPFSVLSNDWALITCGELDCFNTMTVSWGGFGVIWNKNVVTIYIRPQRYTNEFLKTRDGFTLSVLPEDYRSALSYCGKKSGRDVNKVKETGLTPLSVGSSVAFEEARLVLKCRTLYKSRIDKSGFLYKEIDESNYPNHDYHDIYIAEIESAYIKA